MIAVIFEVFPHPDRKQEYLDLAAEMKPMVDQIDGFLSVERFQSLTNPDKLLSISFFRDEDALDRDAAIRLLNEIRTRQGELKTVLRDM